MLITSMEGQSLNDLVSAAKMVYAKAKGEKINLNLIYPRQRGIFIEYRQFTAELEVR